MNLPYKPRKSNVNQTVKLTCIILNDLHDLTKWPIPRPDDNFVDGDEFGVEMGRTSKILHKGNSQEIAHVDLWPPGDSFQDTKEVEVTIEFQKELDGFTSVVRYEIRASAQIIGQRNGTAEVSFKLFIDCKKPDSQPLTLLWDNIGWESIKKWIQKQGICQFCRYGTERVYYRVMEIHSHKTNKVEKLYPETLPSSRMKAKYDPNSDSQRIFYYAYPD